MNALQKSDAIKAGLRKSFRDGSFQIARRECYGYAVSFDGKPEMPPDEVKVVCWIFERHFAGDSPGKVAAGLKQYPEK